MKKIFILFFAIISLAAAYAQCPQYLAFDTSICHSTVNRAVDARVLTTRLCGDSMQVIFNDSLTALSGSRQVYFHAGPEFRAFTGWQTAYTADSAMHKIGAHLWSIKFNPRNFFHYSQDSCLNSIACGFRDSAFVHYVKDGSNDIFILTYTGTATTSYPYVTPTYTHNTSATYAWSDGATDSVRLFTTSGTYTVTATGVGGCTATGTVHIRIGNANVSLGNDTIFCNTGYVLIPTPGFTTYRWGNGTTSSTYIGFNPGRIWVRATDSVGCFSYDTVTVHYSQTWGLKLGDTLRSCPGNPVSADASININRAGDSLVIIYDATQGQTQLANDTNVYFHSGPEFRPFGGWNLPYTVGHFNQNDGLGRMTSLGNHRWRIAIDPQAYYGYLPDSNLNGIFMVFRNFDGTKTGKDPAGNDIYVYTNGVFPFHNLGVQPTCTFAGVTPSLTARQPLYYAWSNGVNTAADTFSNSGVYRVTVSDGVCTRVDSVRAVFFTSSTLSLGADTTVCAGQHVVINAGSGFAHYTWSNGDTTASINVSGAALYSVTATSGSGCISTGSRRVSNSIHPVSLGADIIRCSNTATSIFATSGFTSYSWIGKPAATASTYSAVNAGCYWVKAIDSFGCASYDTVRVINSPVSYLSVPDSVTSCPGNTIPVDASTTISQNGDSIIIIYDATKHSNADSLVGAHKVYMHSGPEFHPFQGWQTAYTVGNFGQDDGIGLMDSIGPNLWRIAIIPQCYYSYSPDTPLNGIWMIFRDATGTHTGKNYTNTDIFVYTAVTPPTSAFNGVMPSRSTVSGVTYLWSTPSGNVSGPIVNATTNGLYIVTATSGICTRMDTVRAIFSNSASLSLGHDTTICFGDSVRIDAGAGYAHYAWSSGDTVRVITAHAAATYSVTATTGAGCSSIGHKVVAISHPSVSLGADQVLCTAAAHTISATPGFASYKWLSRPASVVNNISVNKTGCYWVTATDSFGCVAKDTVSIRYSEVLNENLQDTFRTCPGNLVNLDANTMITLAGDSITIFYDATQGQTGLVGAHKVYMHSGPEFFPFTGWQGNYTVGNYGQDDGVGEMDSLGNNHWKITICPQCYYHYSPDTPLNGIFMIFRDATGANTGKDNAGNNIFLNLSTATPTSSFTGVTAVHKAAGTLSFAWSPGGSTSPAIAVGTSGQYIVTVTDNSGCSKSDTTNVIISSNLTVNIGRDTTICPSGRVTFDAGAGFTAYHWNNGDTTRTITVSAAGIYSVTVSNGNCTAIDSATITMSGIKINLGADVTRCSSAPVTLTAPAGYRSYQWFGVGASSNTRSAVNDGCYWIKATDSAGCTSYDTVSVSTSGVSGLHGHDTLKICTGDSSSFDASVSVNAKGDSLVIIYDATRGLTQLQGDTNIYMHSGPEFHAFTGWQTAYTVGNFNQNDGVGRMTSLGNNKWSITICPSCYYHFNPDTPLAGIFMVFRNYNGTKTGKDSAGNGDIYLNLQGTTPASSFDGITAHYKSGNVSYAWSTGVNTAAATFATAGTYYVTASEGVCTKVDTLVVNAFTKPNVHLGNDTCITSAFVTLNAGSGFVSYVWSTGASTQTVSANLAQLYTVTVTDANGCKGSDSITVSRGVNINLGHDTCINSGTTILLNAGSGAASYLWSDGTTMTDTFRVSVAGTYAVRVSSNGCQSSDTIVVRAAQRVNLGPDTCVHAGSSILLNAGAGATSYAWSNGSTTDTIRVTAPAIYSVTASTGNCASRDTIVVSLCSHPTGCTPIAYFRVLNITNTIVTFKDSSLPVTAHKKYTWRFGDGTIDTLSGGNTVHVYPHSGTYSDTLVVCTDTCGCDTLIRQVTVTALGIAELNGISHISLYPNPANNACMLEVNADKNAEVQVSISDLLGAIVQTQKWQINTGENKLAIDLGGLASGMYHVTLRTADDIATMKLNIIK